MRPYGQSPIQRRKERKEKGERWREEGMGEGGKSQPPEMLLNLPQPLWVEASHKEIL